MPSLRPRFCVGDGVVVLIALLLIFFLVAGAGSGGRMRLELRSPLGNWRYDLPSERRISLEGSAGPFVVVVRPGDSTGAAEVAAEVTIEETHCPDQSCMRMGPLRRAGGTILCLPQRIELTIIADSAAPEVDSVCY